MKKVKFILISISVLAALLISGILIYFLQTPEYYLIKIMYDIKKSGIEGLSPHLTQNAQKTLGMVEDVSENEVVQSVLGILSQNNTVSLLKSEIQKIQWNVEDILKSKNNAITVLSFNYEDYLQGTIKIVMIREDGKWKIDNFEIPRFHEVDW